MRATSLFSAPGASEDASDSERSEALWQANRAVAQAYSLTATDLTHILAGFAVLARKRLNFHVLLLSRLAQWEVEDG